MLQLFSANRNKSTRPARKRNSRSGRNDRRRSRTVRDLRLEGLEGRNMLSVSACLVPEAIDANAPPQAMDDTYLMASDQQLGSGVLANDVDADAMAAFLVESPAHGELVMEADGRFTYKPEPGFSGTDQFTYWAASGDPGTIAPEMAELADPAQSDAGLATVTIVVEAVNAPPVAADDNYTVREDESLIVDAAGVLENDTDNDGDALTAVLVDAPMNGTVTLTNDGSLQYTPNPNFHGTDTFTYMADDGQADSDPATVNITVEAVNDTPVASDDSYTVREDEQLIVQADGLLENDTDIDGDALTAMVVDEPINGTVAVADDGTLEYTPNPDFHGTDTFTYVAHDGQADSDPATVNITVDSVNDAPVASDDSYTVREDEQLIVQAGGLLDNDTDVDGDALTAMVVDEPVNGTLSLGEDGTLQYTPNPDFHGTDTFTYVAHDGQADSDPATVEIEVTPIDLAIELEVSEEVFGTDTDVAWSGATFWVNVYVQDDRDAPLGVVGGALDLLFDPSVVTPTGNVVYGEDFSVFQQGQVDAENGQIDEAGAISVASDTGADDLAPFMAWEFVVAGDPSAILAGTHLHFALEPGEATATIAPADFALVGSGDPVAWDQIALGTADVDLYYGDFNGDSLVNHFDLALWQVHSEQTAESEDFDRLYDFDVDGQIGQSDLDLLLAVMYRPITSLPQREEPADPAGDSSGRIDPVADTVDGNDELLAIDGLFASDQLWEDV